MKVFKLVSNKTAKNSMLTLVGNTISQSMSLLVMVVVSRGLSVAEYGFYCILNNISSFVTDMADMGMNSGITRFVAELSANKETEKENQLINYSIKRKLLNLAIVFVILVIWAKPIAAFWLKDRSLYRYVYLIIITCGTSLLLGAFNAILQGRQQFGKFFISLVLKSTTWCAIIMLMAFCGGLSVGSSVLAAAISGIIALFICVHLLHINVAELGRIKTIDDEIKKRFNSFGNWMMLWALCAILQSKLDVFMLAALTTAEQVSYYDIANKVTKPILMVISAYSQVLNPKFASMAASNLKAQIKTVMKFIMLVTFGIVVSIIVIRPVITFVFGNRYDMAIIPAQMLLFAIVFFAWTVPFNSALYALNKPFVFTLAAFLGVIVTAVGNYLLLGKYGAIGAAITFILAQIVGLLVAACAFFVVIQKKGYAK